MQTFKLLVNKTTKCESSKEEDNTIFLDSVYSSNNKTTKKKKAAKKKRRSSKRQSNRRREKKLLLVVKQIAAFLFFQARECFDALNQLIGSNLKKKKEEKKKKEQQKEICLRKTKSNDDTGLKCACHDDKGKTKRKDLLVESGKKTVKEEAKKKNMCTSSFKVK